MSDDHRRTAVRLSDADTDPDLDELGSRAAAAAGDVDAALRLAVDLGPRVAAPGTGRTRHTWQVLATLGAADLTVARVVEPHLDALAILRQARDAGVEVPDGATDATWGVYAAEGPPPRLEATQLPDRWSLTGRKPWCSLGGRVERALVSAWSGPTERRLFAVDLRADGVSPRTDRWVSRGLAAVDSGPIDFADATAQPIGEPGWYLDRPGFAWGGIGVAAVWFGGAVALARRLSRAAGAREPDQIALMHLGRCDVALQSARCVIADAADRVDRSATDVPFDAARLAVQVRTVVARAVETVLTEVGRGLGPGPLALEEEHARRVADLQVYVRQWHGARDEAVLGRAVLDGSAPAPW